MHLEFRTNNEEIENAIRSFLSHWTHHDSFVVNTSGSTGIPKSITIQNKFARASALKTLEFLDLGKGDTALLCLSPDTIAGKMMLIRALVGELKLIVVDVNSDPLESILDHEKIDFAAMVPLQVENSLKANKLKLKGIRKLIIGGAPISTTLNRRIIEEKLNAYQTFGMTETISHIAMREINEEENAFIAMSKTSFHLGIEDNLIIDAPDIGIHNLETNDIVQLIDERSFMWLGRKDNIINSGGVKISPEQVESKIVSNTTFFVSSLPDEKLGQKVILCVEGMEFDHSKLENLGKYEKPKEIYFFKHFVYTRSNKIDRINTLNQLDHARKQVL